MPSTAVSDEELVIAARGGSRRAASELFRRHWPSAFGAALAVTGRRAMAEDAAQEACVAAFRGLVRFDEARPFRPWLRRIAVNLALNQLRADRRLDLREEVEPEPLDWAEPGTSHEELIGAVAALDGDRRVVVALRYWLDYEPLEIAELLGVPVGTVHSRLGRARAELRERLEVRDG